MAHRSHWEETWINRRERDEFARIDLHQKIEKARLLIGQYEEGLAFQRRLIEDHVHKVGRLDERLGVSE